eukprot:CAMPEP_0118857962 /NCGR_PEP_ID=MMETSP1163-20130328/4842_1 /TAXON_ID=124430 /ORGANISM="Phaeomonas parva, Strain CCMP2877" /LENGTH=72 /DNA_ID=CAMNT_0006791349 /DNA_START=170 /DNA_END=388 /DNA_ORIENTATION=+
MEAKAKAGGREGSSKLTEVLPKTGLVYTEKGNLREALCKPKLMPIRSQHLEKMEAILARQANGDDTEGKQGF